MTSPSYDRLAAQYYNPSLKSLANPGGLAGKGAVRANWAPMLLDFVTVAGEAKANADLATAAAASAVNAPGTSATSSTNMALPAVGADQVFTLDQTGKLFVPGQSVVVSQQANRLNQFIAVLKAFNSGTGVATGRVVYSPNAGAAAVAAWDVGLSVLIDGTLTGRVGALEAANALQRSRRRLIHQELI